MAEVVLFHHALGRTEGFLAFAQALREEGHDVLTPDLFQGVVFDDVEDGIAHAQAIGWPELVRRAEEAVEDGPDGAVYAGMSMGTGLAQYLVQSGREAAAALLLYGVAPLAEFGGSWPAGVPLQIHAMQDDPWVDIETAHAVADRVGGAELFVYPGAGHLFGEEGDPDFEEPQADILWSRVISFLDRV